MDGNIFFVSLHHSKRGRLAQLVQSIWFTPRGSGVRIPHRPLNRVLSSAGSEHLVYTQRVRGSNPLEPTKIQDFYKSWIFLCVFLLVSLVLYKIHFQCFSNVFILSFSCYIKNFKKILTNQNK